MLGEVWVLDPVASVRHTPLCSTSPESKSDRYALAKSVEPPRGFQQHPPTSWSLRMRNGADQQAFEGLPEGLVACLVSPITHF